MASRSLRADQGAATDVLLTGATIAVAADEPATVTAPMTPTIAVCMATYEPALDLLARQIRSIREQTHRDFVCIVSDDASTTVPRAVEQACAEDERFRFVGNSDRSATTATSSDAQLVPPGVRFVALSDQDDVWHADKLETLASAFRSERVQLAYADMAIVSSEGELLAPSYWTDRANNHTDLASLLLINTVTGPRRSSAVSSSTSRCRSPTCREAFHDHWLACIALALGEIAFVDRPLHDYVQHGDNVVGRHKPLPGELRGGLVNALADSLATRVDASGTPSDGHVATTRTRSWCARPLRVLCASA